jgi:tripartite-type tricarboxylate transporter receptor subunit TctC
MKTFLILFLLLFSQISLAKTVTVVIPFSAGGPTDTLWRVINPELNENLSKHGIRLVIENLPGASGTIAANKIARTSDRLILGFFSPALAISSALIPDAVKYDVNSINLVGYAGETNMIVVSKLNRKDFEKKCKNDKIFFGSSGNGSTGHLLGSVVAKKIQCQEIIHVPYKGNSAAYVDLLAGRIDYLVDFSINALGYISNGSVKELFSMNEEFPNNLESWHVLISNNIDHQTLKIIQQEFNRLKSNKEFTEDLENRLKLRNFSKIKNHQWLVNEFNVYRKFVQSIQ